MYTWHLKILQRYFLSYVMFEWFIIINFVNREPNKKNDKVMNKDGPRSKKEKRKKIESEFYDIISAFSFQSFVCYIFYMDRKLGQTHKIH